MKTIRLFCCTLALLLGSSAATLQAQMPLRRVISLAGQFSLQDVETGMIISQPYESLSIIENSNLARGKRSYGHWALIDILTGEEILPAVYSGFGSRFSEGLCWISYNGRIGYIDIYGNLAIPIRYDSFGDFRDGYVRIKRNNRWGYLDLNGRWYTEQPLPYQITLRMYVPPVPYLRNPPKPKGYRSAPPAPPQPPQPPRKQQTARPQSNRNPGNPGAQPQRPQQQPKQQPKQQRPKQESGKQQQPSKQQRTNNSNRRGGYNSGR